MGIRPDKSFWRIVQHLNISDRVLIEEYQSEDRLIQAIDGAEFFVFPSFYEGFGFPPLEAMARKKAVISSTGGSLKEILEDSALFFNPESSEDLSEKISIFLENKGLRENYQQKGFTHSQKFRWYKAVEKYLSVLKEIA